MSGLYPSLEDLHVDKMAKTQVNQERVRSAIAQSQATGAPVAVSLYGNLGLEDLMGSYGGLDISPAAIARYVAPDVASQLTAYGYTAPLVSVTPVGDKALARAEVKNGVREVVLCKDQTGKIGICAQSIDKGVFIALVYKNSPAALAGLRFGDQILQINGENVAGWSNDKAISFLKKADGARITLAIRDRPFDRTVTVVKDSNNVVGFTFTRGEVDGIVKDSSAARNGLLINHHIVEVNSQNVVGMPDKELLQLIREAPRSVTLTIMPTFVYDHLITKMSSKDLKKMMDRGVPDF
jgi:syntenin-1